MATTFRADQVAAHVAILNEQKAATPDLLRGVWSSRPGSYNELPLAFVGERSETIRHDSGTRTREFGGFTVTLVDAFTDAAQTASRLDQLVDALVDRYDIPANVQRVPKTIIELTEVNDTELEVAGREGQPTRYYPAVVLTFGKSAIKEGRQ